MNKSIFTLSLIFFSLFIFACKEEREIDSMSIHFVDMNIETPMRVSCSNFEMLFAGSYDTTFITNEQVLSKFESYLSDCKQSDSDKEIDVRVKAVINFSDKKKSILCLDKFDNVVIDDRLVKANKAFAGFIRDQLVKK